MTPGDIFREDLDRLYQLEHAWIGYQLLKLIDPDPWERAYYDRLELTAYDLLCRLESKMVRRYL